ncbi:hypothetical protein MNV49_006412 [Pseudohyphozyma bogoriensis]|nr:hypothetical protein MNV49_006412 [Pseudohyphozyma bogoriensis]
MATRLSVADVAHRTLVSGLFGLTLWGGYGIWSLHQQRLKLGLEALAKHEAEQKLLREQNGWTEPTTTSDGQLPRSEGRPT